MEGGTTVSEREVEGGKGWPWEEVEVEVDVDEEVEEAEVEEGVESRSSPCSAKVSRQLPPFLFVAPLTWIHIVKEVHLHHVCSSPLPL